MESRPTSSYGVPMKGEQKWKPFHHHMASLRNRVQSFQDWPDQVSIRIWRLVRSGFFYWGQGDTVVCFHCGVTVFNWDKSQDVDKEHRKYNENCIYWKMVCSPNEVARMEVPAFLCHNLQSKAKISSFSPPNFSFGDMELEMFWSPVNEEMMSLEKRVETFKNWPPQMTQRPMDLAWSGFYYLGCGDQIKCFQCGLGLNYLDKDDDINLDHKKYSPDCKYVFMARDF